MQTSMRVTQENRDALARIAANELGGVSRGVLRVYVRWWLQWAQVSVTWTVPP